MAVNLSPLGGAGAQFSDDNGNPLAGGFLYTYLAGTTTDAAAYTSSDGGTAHTNPIVLDAGGRVPDGGEIWLTNGTDYKFILKSSADILVATWDHIYGVGVSNLEASATRDDTKAILWSGATDTPTTGKIATWDGMPFIDVRVLDADPTGAADSSPAFNSITSSAIIPAGTYRMTSVWGFALSNIVIQGAGIDNTIITTATLKELVKFVDTSINVVFSDITFESTLVNAVEDVYGLINAQDIELNNINFVRCKFTCPDLNTNAVKIINQDTQVADNINFKDCIFEDVGRMGVEFQNHNDAAPLARYKDVNVTNCVFKGMGTQTSFGMGVSLSGIGYGCNVADNLFDDCYDVALEGVGCSHSTFKHNKFANMTRGCAPVSFTGARVMTENVFDGNVTVGQAVGGLNIRNQVRPIVVNNVFDTTVQATILDSIDGRWSNNLFKTEDVYSVLISSSTGNQFINCTFDNSANAGNFSCVRLQTSSENNRFYNCTINKGTGGVNADNLTSSINNYFYNSVNGADGTPLRAYINVTIPDADYDFAATEGGLVLPKLLRVNGTLTATRVFTMPTTVERILVWNTTGQTLTVDASGATGVALLNGTQKDYIYNGTDIILV